VALAVALLAATAACGGGGGSAPSGSSAAASSFTARLTIVIPPAASASVQSVAGRRHAEYVSPSTVTVVVTGLYGSASPGPGEAVNVGPNSANCTTDTSGNRTCTVSVAVQQGATALDVAALDANGNLLAHAVVTLPAISNPIVDITVTLGGDPAHVTLLLVGGEFPVGVPGTRTLEVTAEDADGNAIGLPGAYDVPVALTASNASITIVPTLVIDPGDSAMVTYDGIAPNSSITASVGGKLSTVAVVNAVGTGPPVLTLPTPTPLPTATPLPTMTPSPGPSTGTAIIIINGRKR
jgi:hypothetical protein